MANSKRLAMLAISFPNVVGDAGCPWVLESIGNLACFTARVFSALRIFFSCGNKT